MYENPVIISFDLSTTVVGICIYDINTKSLLKLYSYSFLSKEMLDKSLELETLIDNLLGVYIKVSFFIIEERLKSFRAGGTNANAMLKLAAFNFLCQTLLYKRKIPIKEINVITCRALVFPGFHKVARAIKNHTKQKEYAFQLVVERLGEDMFPKKILKSGKNKGESVFVDEARDMADAFILGEAALIQLEQEKKLK